MTGIELENLKIGDELELTHDLDMPWPDWHKGDQFIVEYANHYSDNYILRCVKGNAEGYIEGAIPLSLVLDYKVIKKI